jgi:hypothetical protein
MSSGMSIQLDGSGPVDMSMEPPSFTLSQSGTFVKEDFVINRQGIAAVNGTEVARVVGLRLADLELLEVLGKGASSLVRRAVHTPSQTELAVKVINVFDKAKRDQLLRELRTLYSSAFPWLVSFHDCLYDEGAMYIVLECARTPSTPRAPPSMPTALPALAQVPTRCPPFRRADTWTEGRWPMCCTPPS